MLLTTFDMCNVMYFIRFSVLLLQVSIFLYYRSFIEESGANIKISAQDNSYVGLNDRLVTIIGTLQQLGQAINLILLKLSEDGYYVQSIGPTFPYAGILLCYLYLIFISYAFERHL